MSLLSLRLAAGFREGWIPAANEMSLSGVASFRKHHILLNIRRLEKKSELSEKKDLQVGAWLRKYPFTGGAEMHRRGARRASGYDQGNETQK